MKKKKDGFITEAVSPVIGVMLMLVVTVIIAAVVSGFAGDMGLDKKTGPTVTLSEPVMELSTTDGTAEDITYNYVGTQVVSIPDWGMVETYPISEGGSFHIVTSNGDPYGLVFTHTGGDPIDLKDLQMGFSSNDLGIVVDYNSKSALRGDQSYHNAYDGDYYVGYTYSYDGPDPYGYGVQYIEEITIDSFEVSGGYTEDDFDDLQAMVDNSISDPAKYFLKISPETYDDTIIRTGDQFEVAMDGTPTYWCIQAYNDGIYQSFYIEEGSGNEWILSHKPSGQILARGDIVYETEGYTGEVF